MVKVAFAQTDNAMYLDCPYNHNFVQRAHRLAGQWDEGKGRWRFDARDLEKVKKACMEVFGTDGSIPEKLFTLQARAIVEISASRKSIFFAGHQIARAWGRDSGARLGDGVILLEGEVRSGGSRVNWDTIIDDGSVIEIKDLTPKQVDLAKRSAERYEKWEILSVVEQPNIATANHIEEEERALRKRLKEIKDTKDALLTKKAKSVASSKPFGKARKSA